MLQSTKLAEGLPRTHPSKCVEGVFSEVRRHGVLRSSTPGIATWHTTDLFPKSWPSTMRVQPSPRNKMRTFDEENPTYIRTDRPHAARGIGKAGRRQLGPRDRQGARHQRGYVPLLGSSLRQDELTGGQSSEGTGVRECPPEEAARREGTGHRHAQGGESGNF